ncbi:NACHT domain-containing protein [Saccharothrix variisporea]|uniref:NACHT domain-containing protein n=1 Tax=Saccharothrix variisporea TaxID=543527 RepID=A0A495XCY2_9PSEU|nr:NACHT domain-containing protein [Saccharothrix variisporea]RKT70473.1 NACHT domain-containing protein [Saccharothrix variisporea]
MPGFEEPLIGRLLGQAAKPLVDNVRHALARRGYGRTDVHTALNRLTLAPATFSLVLRLPIGFTQQDVAGALASPEGDHVLRRILALNLEGRVTEGIRTKVEASVLALISAQVRKRYRVSDPPVPFADLRFDRLREYTAQLCELLFTRGQDWAKALLRSLKDPAESLDWAFTTLVRHQLAEVEHYLDVLASAVEPTAEAFEEWRRTYLTVFAAHHSTMQLPHFERKLVPYDDLFVPSQFRPWGESARNLVHDAEISFERFAGLVDKTVIVGDPGGGKSTTSTLLARRALDRGDIPFVVALKAVDVGLNGFNVEEAVESLLRTGYQCPAPPGTVRKLLAEGRAFLVFDGLDELVDGATREAAAKTIDTIATIHPFAKVVVTSRRVGYSVARLNPRTFDEFLIGSFTDQQVEQYARRWFSIVREPGDPSVEGTVQGFLESGKPIADLRTNPLMLAFICVLYQGRGTIPHKRPEIFRECVELFLHHWDRKRRIGRPPADLDLIELSLSYLAHAVLTDRAYRDGVTEEQVFALVVEPLLAEGVPDRRTAKRVVRELLDLCRGRAWIFTDVGGDPTRGAVFAFTHPSFLEYFAALHLNRTVEGPEEIAAILIPEIARGQWEVVGQICISLRLRNFQAGAARIMDSFLRRIEAVITDRRRAANRGATWYTAPRDHLRLSPLQKDVDVALVEFLLRTSETLPVSSDTLRRLVEIGADHFSMGRSAGLSALLNTDYQYLDAVYEKLTSLLGSALRSFAADPDDTTATHAWFAVHFGYLAGQPLAHHVDLARLHDTRARIVDPSDLDLLAGHRTVFAWNLRLHAGGTPDLDEPGWFGKLFEGCHRQIPGFGPQSTAQWIVDCFSSPFRRSLPVPTAAALLRSLAPGIAWNNDLPAGGEAHTLPVEVVTAASARVIGYDDTVLAGWCTVAMAVHELWEVTTHTPRTDLLGDTTLRPLFDHAIRRGVPGAASIHRWLDGEVSIWKEPGTSVS